jgi:hypothetical protein
MAKYRLIAMANPRAGQEEEYVRWYHDHHMHEVLEVDGIVAGQRFRVAESQLSQDPSAWRYLAIYELDTDDPQAVVDALLERAKTMTPTDTGDPDSRSYNYVFEAITERIQAPKVATEA